MDASLLPRPAASRRWLVWPLLTLAVGLAITFVLAQRQATHNARVIHARLNDALQQFERQLSDAVTQYAVLLRSVRGSIVTHSTDWVDPRAFRSFVLSQDLAVSFAGAHGFGFARRVAPDAVEDFVQNVRSEGFPGYQVLEQMPGQGDRWLVQMVEPREHQDGEIGLDLATVPERRLAALRAIETGREAITPPIDVVAAGGETHRVLSIMLPVYRSEAMFEDAGSRRSAGVGWVYALLGAQEMMAGIPLASGVSLHMADISPNGLSTMFYSNQDRVGPVAETALRVTRDLPMFNRTWRLTADAAPAFIGAQNLLSPTLLALQGVMTTLVLALLHLGWLVSVSRQRDRQQSQALLAAITENTAQAVVGEDVQGRIISWNRAAAVLFGIPARVAIGRDLDDVLAERRLRLTESEGQRMLSGQGDKTTEARLCLQDVVVRHLAVSRNAIVDERDQTIGRATLLLDITQIKLLSEQVEAANRDLEAKVQARTQELTLARDKLAVSQRFLERIGRVSGVAGWRYSFADERFHWTPEMLELVEVDENFVVDDNVLRHFVSLEHRARLEAARREVIEGRADSFDLEIPVVTAKGRQLWVRVVGEPMLGDGPDSKPVGLIGAVQDISMRHQAQQDLEEAVQQAEAANQSKSQFLANMSHEIRTPLNALLGITDLMLGSPLNEEQRQLMLKSKTAGRSLMAIVNNVLDLAKIESGRMQLVVGVVDVQALLEEVRTLYAPQAQAKGLALETGVATNTPRYLRGDRDRLREMLVNLVGNAIKFTERGQVSVQVQVVTEASGKPLVQWHVRDTGIGLSPEQASRLFQPFVQADASTTRRFGGTGLGLSIVKRLSELMGGRPGVSSQPGQGSDFWFELPLQLPDPDEIARLERGQHVLDVVVVSGSAPWRQTCCQSLTGFGWYAEQAPSGAALLALLGQRLHDGQELPDVLIVDQVEDMPRAQLLEPVRGLIKGAETVLLLTQEGPTEAGGPAGTAGEALLTLPLESSTLFNTVTNVLVEHGQGERATMGGQLTFGAGMLWLDGASVLLVEDNEINMEIAQRLLTEQGARVHGCVNGREAVDWLADPAHDVDLVLMDVQMPVMDGLEATRLIKADARLARLPVLALTAGALEEERRRALDAGMNDFLTKPLEAEQLIRAIRAWIESYRGHAPQVRSQGAGAAPANDDWPELPGIEVSAARARMGNDLALLGRMLGLMLADQPPGDQWQDPGTSEARQRMAAQMHKLKGSSGTLGAVGLYEAARRAEQSLRAEAADINDALAAVQAALAPLKTSLAVLEAREAARLPAGGQVSVSAEDHARLRGLLETREFEAVDLFGQLRTGLQQQLPEERFAALDQAMLALRFQDALQALG